MRPKKHKVNKRKLNKRKTARGTTTQDIGTPYVSHVKKTSTYRKLFYFILVGGIGFIVDGGLLTLLSQIYHHDVYLSRLLSFSLATLTTWSLNRVLVFKHDINPNARKRVEYIRYLLVQICGGLTNLLVFTYAIALYPLLKSYLIIPFFVGSVFGLLINFTGSRYWVFKNKPVKLAEG